MMRTLWRSVAATLAVSALSCGSSHDGANEGQGGAMTGGAPSQNPPSAGGAPSQSPPSAGGAPSQNPPPGAGGDSSQIPPPGPFPNGGRQYKSIVNLVAPAIVQAVEAALSDTTGVKDYSAATRAFYDLYPDEYDFLYLFLDHQLPDAEAEAAFQVANRPAIPGTGIDKPVALSVYGSRGRLRGTCAFQAPVEADSFPAIAHETAHYWANYLDPALGFGHDHDQDYGPHWGITGVYGQLGGFDPKSLECIDPMNTVPPACTLDPMLGLYSYVTSAFAPNTNTFRGVPYAPLELYMMGLLPQAELPASFPVVQDARFHGLVQDFALLEGSGIGSIAVSSIVARHGVRTPAADSDKQFTAAFVIVSAMPEPDAMLDQVVTWQQLWGGEIPANSGVTSFEEATGGRAKMTTRIGRPRTNADPPPAM